MDLLNSYYEYEDAYCKMQYEKLKDLGLEMLSFINDKESKELIKKLSKTEWNSNLSEEKRRELSNLYLEIKNWIMVHIEF